MRGLTESLGFLLNSQKWSQEFHGYKVDQTKRLENLKPHSCDGTDFRFLRIYCVEQLFCTPHWVCVASRVAPRRVVNTTSHKCPAIGRWSSSFKITARGNLRTPVLSFCWPRTFIIGGFVDQYETRNDAGPRTDVLDCEGRYARSQILFLQPMELYRKIFEKLLHIILGFSFMSWSSKLFFCSRFNASITVKRMSFSKGDLSLPVFSVWRNKSVA